MTMRKHGSYFNIRLISHAVITFFLIYTAVVRSQQVSISGSWLNPDSSGMALGVYQPAQDPLSHGTAIDKYTNEVGEKPAFAWFSVKWENDQTGEYQQFDPALPDQFRTRGIMPGLTWDASKGSALNENQPDFSWEAIASGKHDAYITQVAKDVAAYHYPFILRMLHEMDGNWYPWGYGVNGNANAADYVTAWKHIVDIFRKEGATNVQFAWVVAAGILTNNVINNFGDTLKAMYPGDNYVDWVGFDGYTSNPGSQSFQDVFQPSYNFITSFSNRPMMIFEAGCTEDTADSMAKANWITKGFLTTIPNLFPRVKVADWFNSKNDKGTKDYSIETSQNALNAWKQVAASPFYQGNLLTDIRKENNTPVQYELLQNYPNPFNPSTTIKYDLPKSENVKLIVYDILGRQVATLVNADQNAGKYKVQWNGHNDSGESLASGIYLYSFEGGNYKSVKKMIYLK